MSPLDDFRRGPGPHRQGQAPQDARGHRLSSSGSDGPHHYVRRVQAWTFAQIYQVWNEMPLVIAAVRRGKGAGVSKKKKKAEEMKDQVQKVREIKSFLNTRPLAAIDEGDKIRTIYDGSWGRANARIQQNTVEKTTAPTVMDCIQAIHWLNQLKGRATPPVASGTDMA